MTFYCKNLEEKIFNKHTDLTVEPDELIIISGYLGPSPVERLKELPFKTTVIAGMYTRGVNPKLYNALKKSTENNPNLTVLFSSIEVHSKI
ncbi:MAG: NgoFVII family restriction endonuclease [Lactobacillus johnsonii]|nr:NgoFVII family restriction endonuclease [Lactobacillus johnsonii]